MSTQAIKTAALLRKCMAVADKSPKIDRAKLVGTAAVQDIGVILTALEHNPEAAADANYQRGHEIGYREGQASKRPLLSEEAMGDIARWLSAEMDVAVSNGADSRSMPDTLVEIAAWLGTGAVPTNPVRNTTRLYYECHITLDPVPEAGRDDLQRLLTPHGFKLAKLLMDKGVPSQLDTFATGHSKFLSVMTERMRSAIIHLQAAGYVVRRYKIEDTVLDSKHGDSI